MDVDWDSNLSIDPRELELNPTISLAPGVSTSSHAPHANSFNVTHSSLDFCTDGPALQGDFVSTALTRPYLARDDFAVGMSTLGTDFQPDGTVGIPVRTDSNQSFRNAAGCMESTHPTFNAGLGAQYPLPPYMYLSLDHHQREESQSFNQDFRGSMTQLPANPKVRQRRDEASSSTTSNGFSFQPRRDRRSGSIRSSDKTLVRSVTPKRLNSRRRPSPQKRVTLIPEVVESKKPKPGVAVLQSNHFSFDCTTNTDASKTCTAKLQEDIALVQKSTKQFSPPLRRKVVDILGQMTNLVNQLGQVVIDEEKYGKASTDNKDIAPSSTSSSSKDSISNSELVDLESDTDNTSLSSISRQRIVEDEDPVSLEDDHYGPVHTPCIQCGFKSLYSCTREDEKTKKGCRYSTHSLPEWKRHEKSQKHAQQERYMCLECSVSPPPIDMNGDPICEFCHISFPTPGGSLTVHYLQCQSAQQAGTTYGRKDRLIAHLRSHLGIANISQIAAAGRYTVNSRWPRQCGFCGVIFNTWDERMDHIAGHFQDGLGMSSWKLPFPRPKDFRSGMLPQPKGDDDDSDDDMDDNDSRPSGKRPGSHQEFNFTGSSQKGHSNGAQIRGLSSQGGNKHRCQSPQAYMDKEVRRIGNNVPRNVKTSVALERYLNDVELPIEIRLSLGSSNVSQAGSNQGTSREAAKARSKAIEAAAREDVIGANIWLGLKEEVELTKPNPKPNGQLLVRKAPRQGLRRTCCKSSTLFGTGVKLCSDCQHTRCTDCPRDPAKKKKYPEGYPGDAPSDGISKLLKHQQMKLYSRSQSVRRPLQDLTQLLAIGTACQFTMQNVRHEPNSSPSQPAYPNSLMAISERVSKDFDCYGECEIEETLLSGPVEHTCPLSSVISTPNPLSITLEGGIWARTGFMSLEKQSARVIKHISELDESWRAQRDTKVTLEGDGTGQVTAPINDSIPKRRLQDVERRLMAPPIPKDKTNFGKTTTSSACLERSLAEDLDPVILSQSIEKMKREDKGPNKSDILNGAVSWTRDLMWMLHLKLQQQASVVDIITDLGKANGLLAAQFELPVPQDQQPFQQSFPQYQLQQAIPGDVFPTNFHPPLIYPETEDPVESTIELLDSSGSQPMLKNHGAKFLNSRVLESSLPDPQHIGVKGDVIPSQNVEKMKDDRT